MTHITEPKIDEQIDKTKAKILNESVVPRRELLLEELAELMYKKGFKEAEALVSDQVAKTRIVTGETSDGYHTFNELYEFRLLYNACFFNELAREPYTGVCKSWKHSDGELCFGGGWFVVTAQLPTGQITNHYEAKDWDLFNIPEVETAPEWDGHTPQDVATRLRATLNGVKNK